MHAFRGFGAAENAGEFGSETRLLVKIRTIIVDTGCNVARREVYEDR